MEKYVEYAKTMSDMAKLFDKLKKMENDVIEELRAEGFVQDVISNMMAISKGRVNQRCRNIKKTIKIKEGRVTQ